MRLAVRELLLSDRAQVIPDGPGPSSEDDEDLASVVLAQLSHGQREALLEKAARMRRRRNQCSSAIVGSAIRRCAPRHLLQVAVTEGRRLSKDKRP